MMPPGAKFAFECCLRGTEKMTDREANAEINANWLRIWSIGQPLGMTKLEAWKLAWACYKHKRRQWLRELRDKRVRTA